MPASRRTPKPSSSTGKSAKAVSKAKAAAAPRGQRGIQSVEVGGGPKSNVTFPEFRKVAGAFGFAYSRAERHEDLAGAIASALASDGPAMCEILIDEAVPFAPKLGAKQHPDGRITSPPLEDLSPFLPREVLRENMRIGLVDE